MLEAIYFAWVRWGYARRIRKRGWTGTYVPGDALTASMAYSTGFWESVGYPDIIMFGFDMETSNGLLHHVYDRLKDGALVLSDMQPLLDEGGARQRLMLRAAHPSHLLREYFNLSIWYWERKGRDRRHLRAFQLVMSDAAGAFPWEAEYDKNYRPIQPSLYEPYDGPPDED